MPVNSLSSTTASFPVPVSTVPSFVTGKSNHKPNLLKKATSHFFSKPKNKYDLLKRLLTSGIIGYALAKTPFLWVNVNNSLQISGITPTARATLPFTKNSPFNENFDNFIENTEGFENIHVAIHQAGIEEPKHLDTNKSGIILDNDSEYESLINLLESKKNTIQDTAQLASYDESLKLIKQYRELNKVLWGEDELKPENIYQVGDNCQIVSDILGSSFTPENIQRLKYIVRVTDFNLDKKNFYINCIVNLNGKFVTVTYDELRNWRGIKQKNAPEAPYIIAYAVEKELEKNHIPNPFAPTSAASTLLLREDYTFLPTFAISDETLIKIFSEAPNQIIKVGSYPETQDYYGRVKEYFTGEGPYREEEINSKIRPYHEYVVKEINYINGESIVTVTTLNPDHNRYEEVELTIPELRSHMLTIAAPSSQVPYIDESAFQKYLFALALILLVRTGFIKLERSKMKSELQ